MPSSKSTLYFIPFLLIKNFFFHKKNIINLLSIVAKYTFAEVLNFSITTNSFFLKNLLK